MKKIFLILASVMVLSVLALSGLVMAQTSANLSTTASVTISGFISLSLTGTPINFGNLILGDINKPQIPNDPDNGLFTVSVGGETNVIPLIYTKAGSATFLDTDDNVVSDFVIGNMRFQESGGSVKTYTTSNQLVTNFGSKGAHSLAVPHTLNVPYALVSGTYHAGIIITATDTAL